MRFLNKYSHISFSKFYLYEKLSIICFTWVVFACFPSFVPLYARDSLGESIWTQAKSKVLHENKYWKSILFYEKKWLGTEESVVDSPNFFLAGNGKISSAEEMKATIYAFYQEAKNFSDLNEHAQCRFPARLKWLGTKLNLKDLPKISCPDYEQWRQEVIVKDISVVFASNYLNNPASLFGHTFLRLHKKKRDSANQEYPLLDYALNFAANPTTQNPFLYSLYGLIGKFKGTFSLMPYYIKVQEYNNVESRNLWEYLLPFSEDDIDSFLSSLWEVGNQTMDYYYFDENCSYILLMLLDASRSDIHLAEEFSTFVIPSDTIKSVIRSLSPQPDFKVRPSTLTKFQSILTHLTQKQRSWLNKAVSLGKLPDFQSFQKSEQAPVLDALLEWLDFKEKARGDKTSEFSEFRNQILKSRASLGVTSNYDYQGQINSAYGPHLGHGGQKVSVGLGVRNWKRSYLDMGWRFSLHEFSDGFTGYGDDLEIVMGAINIRANRNKSKLTLNIQNYTLFSVMSLPEYDALLKSPSWHFHIEGNRDPFSTFLEHEATGGVGLSFKFSSLAHLKFYGFVDMGLGYLGPDNKELNSAFIAGHLGAHVAVNKKLMSQWDIIGGNKYFNETWHKFMSLESSIQYLGFSNWSLGVKIGANYLYTDEHLWDKNLSLITSHFM